jgi:hypothetical protein
VWVTPCPAKVAELGGHGFSGGLGRRGEKRSGRKWGRSEVKSGRRLRNGRADGAAAFRFASSDCFFAGSTHRRRCPRQQ